MSISLLAHFQRILWFSHQMEILTKPKNFLTQRKSCHWHKKTTRNYMERGVCIGEFVIYSFSPQKKSKISLVFKISRWTTGIKHIRYLTIQYFNRKLFHWHYAFFHLRHFLKPLIVKEGGFARATGTLSMHSWIALDVCYIGTTMFFSNITNLF